jgi:hypothetical protein|tara:strand:+ start:6049 stop:6921 length:873 start_codon:yes stop_codon:yes gene_type:complete
MSVGIYGTKVLSNVNSNDVDVLYSYTASREAPTNPQMIPLFGAISDNEFKKLTGADGVYELRLPASIFNRLGFYTVLIKPKSFETTIIDCSVVVTNTDTEIQISKKGIIIPKLQFQSPGSLIGYMIEYFDENGVKTKNFHRIVTTSEVVSVSANNNNSNASSNTYVIDPNGTNLFLTLTPDERNLISNSQQVNLGNAGQKILVTATSFDPTVIQVEMVDQTVKTLSYALYGNTIRDNATGKYRVFDENGFLFREFNLLTRKSEFTSGNLDYKQRIINPDLTRTFNTIING